MPFIVADIYAPDELPHNMILSSKEGDLLLTDSDLGSHIHHASKVSVDQPSFQKHFLFSRSECSFLSSRASSSAVVVAHLRRTDSLSLVLFGVAEGSIEELQDVRIPLDDRVSEILS